MMIMAYDCDSQSQCNQLQQRQRSEYLMILFFSISLGLFFFSFCCLFFALYRSIDLLLIFLSTYARVCVHTDFLSYYAYRKKQYCACTNSILGMNLFGCKFCRKTSDQMTSCDRKNFDSLLWAIVTVFQVFSYSNYPPTRIT